MFDTITISKTDASPFSSLPTILIVFEDLISRLSIFFESFLLRYGLNFLFIF